MTVPILATKLYIPPPRSKSVLRPRLLEQLNDGLHRKLSLISAPAGFGKTTLVSEWVASCERPVAWLSLDEGDNEPTRFLAYLIAALQTIVSTIGQGMLAVLHTTQSQPPPAESILTSLLNEIAAIPYDFTLVLDDYHIIETQHIDQALTFLLEHLPSQMHLVIATRENPPLPLARLRARDQLTELRAADLRFTSTEVAEFLNQAMGLNLSAKDIAALETRTEGWIAGLQLAAISMQGREDIADFIQSFTGSHHFVLDYLVEEVLHQQPESIQTFLLRTSILDRLCGPLCDAVRFGYAETPSSSEGITSKDEDNSQKILEYLERANLFIVPLDNERRWYRYHHLFAGFLRQRLRQSSASPTSEGHDVAEYHIRASQWYEDNNLQLEAFRHAAAANDIDRAERLVDSKRMPVHLRDTVTTILDWLGTLPKATLDARPALWIRSATLSLVAGQTTGVEEKLKAAESALVASGALATVQQDAEPAPPALGKIKEFTVERADAKTRNLIGIVAAARATLALTKYQAESIFVQSRRALEYLAPDNLTFRFTAMWAMAFAHRLQGDRAAAIRAYTEAISISQTSGYTWSTMLATSGLGEVQELENQLYQAAETYRRVLQLHGAHPQPSACEEHLGLARIFYEWNDLDAAEQHGQQSLQLARQYDSVIDRFIISEVFLARLKLAQGDIAGAAAMLAEASQTVRRHNFVHRMPEVAAAQVRTLLRQGNLASADRLANEHDLPLCRARVHLAQGDISAAMAILEPLRQQMKAKSWQDELLKVMVLQTITHYVHGEKEKAVQLLSDTLALAEPGGFIRTFVDEGLPMAQLLSEVAAQGIMPGYVAELLAAFEAEQPQGDDETYLSSPQPLIEPLSQRELQVLQLIAQGFSNREIGERLFIALDTVKGHNRRIYAKLQVQRRTEAVAKARSLNILPHND